MNNISGSLLLLTASVTKAEETTAENVLSKNDLGSALVAFLYFLGVLLLIYIILMLVSKWGKKKQHQKTEAESKEDNKDKEGS